MAKVEKSAISPTREEDYSEWYQQVVKASDMAERSPVRGCMVIKPWGYSLWENIVRELDDMFKDVGVKNAYFPLFIPLGFLEKEASHVEGFAKECAVVTHHRLEKNTEGRLVPAGPLTEPLVVRPTSETIIGDAFSKWVSSYRDLPLLINQWVNVVRWEMRTRIFLRTSEFLWQEGHSAHATEKEAMERTRLMLNIYARLAEEYLALPVTKGRKTAAERFPGAVETFCIEAMMQDRKALQAGTSHFLGQNFAKASGIKFQSFEEKEEYAWTVSWGASTRMIGGIIMMHGDDDGVILPPRVASSQVVFIPIYRSPDDRSKVMEYIQKIVLELKSVFYCNRKIRVELDDRDTGGARGWEWIKKGIPLRVEVGPRDMDQDSVYIARRDKPHREKISMKRDVFVKEISGILDEIQKNLYEKAVSFKEKNTIPVDGVKAFHEFFTPLDKEQPEIHGGFAMSHWCGAGECEAKIKEELSVTIRCIPSEQEPESGNCVCCGGHSSGRVVFAKAY